jgi:hypothetical protein
LEVLATDVGEEIRSYPTPIPACDAQFNHLLELRRLLHEELERLDAAALNHGASAEEFVRTSRCNAELSALLAEELDRSIDVLSVVRRLDLPARGYLVYGGGVLAALGLRECADVDLLVTPNVFEDLKTRGWRHRVVSIEGRPREKVSHHEVEAFKEFWCAGNVYDIAAMIHRAQVIGGVQFMSLPDLLEVKRCMGRNRDLRDIELIEAYLRSRPPE